MAAPNRALLDASMTEAQWQRQVIELAECRGWIWHHETDSRKSKRGWPDLVLCRCLPGKLPWLCFIELKDSRRKVTTEQRWWLHALSLVARASGGLVFAAVWRPADWDGVRKVLM